MAAPTPNFGEPIPDLINQPPKVIKARLEHLANAYLTTVEPTVPQSHTRLLLFRYLRAGGLQLQAPTLSNPEARRQKKRLRAKLQRQRRQERERQLALSREDADDNNDEVEVEADPPVPASPGVDAVLSPGTPLTNPTVTDIEDQFDQFTLTEPTWSAVEDSELDGPLLPAIPTVGPANITLVRLDLEPVAGFCLDLDAENRSVSSEPSPPIEPYAMSVPKLSSDALIMLDDYIANFSEKCYTYSDLESSDNASDSEAEAEGEGQDKDGGEAANVDTDLVNFTAFSRYYFSHHLIEVYPIFVAADMRTVTEQVQNYLKFLLSLDEFAQYHQDITEAIGVTHMAAKELPAITAIVYGLPDQINRAKFVRFYQVSAGETELDDFVPGFQLPGYPKPSVAQSLTEKIPPTVERTGQSYQQWVVLAVDGESGRVRLGRWTGYCPEGGQYWAPEHFPVAQRQAEATLNHYLAQFGFAPAHLEGLDLQGPAETVIEFDPEMAQRMYPGLILGGEFQQLSDGSHFVDHINFIFPSYYLEIPELAERERARMM
ncbi:hypothetical protein H4R33_003508 [Dimargaris cristalligena]|nr:hypothetical protein H4R33_003508 [Dimargaris cristalligena]